MLIIYSHVRAVTLYSSSSSFIHCFIFFFNYFFRSAKNKKKFEKGKIYIRVISI